MSNTKLELPFLEWNQPFWFKIEPNSSQDYTKVDQRSAFPYVGGETSGLDRLNHYLWKSHAVATYKQTRNGLIGVDYSTKFSPWLALGCLSPRKIFWEIKKYEEHEVSNQSTYWVIFELIWRDYFKFVCQKYGDSVFYLTGKPLYHTKWVKSLIFSIHEDNLKMNVIINCNFCLNFSF